MTQICCPYNIPAVSFFQFGRGASLEPSNVLDNASENGETVKPRSAFAMRLELIDETLNSRLIFDGSAVVFLIGSRWQRQNSAFWPVRCRGRPMSTVSTEEIEFDVNVQQSCSSVADQSF